MDFAEMIEKIASGEEPMNDIEKVAAYYDNMGRQLFFSLLEANIEKAAARKLPPGMFSGRKGLKKLLLLGGVGGGSYVAGSRIAKKKGEEDDVELANRAYQMGVKRGATLVLHKLRGMGG